MPLFAIEDTTTPIRHIPHAAQYRELRGRMSDRDYQAVVDELNARIEGHEVRTSSWLPGADWEGTVFYPLYLAARRDTSLSAKFFGQIVWAVFMERAEDWSFIRAEKDGVPIPGLTYFQITR